MAQIPAAAVKALRAKSGAGVLDCKNALEETGGDIAAAVDLLRRKGLAAARRKAGRAAAEGLVAVRTGDGRGVVVEINSETDFVARNAGFQAFVATVADVAFTLDGDTDALGAAGYPGTDRSVAEELTRQIATVGENLALRRSAGLVVDGGVVASYVHAQAAPDLGRIGVLVGLKSDGDAATVAAFGKRLAMHVAAAQPQFLDTASVDDAARAREREVLAAQARAEGKPDEIVARMVEGRLRKFYEDVVLLEQTYVIDGESKVSKAVAAAGEDAGAPVAVTGFVRFALGEGVERTVADEDAQPAR